LRISSYISALLIVALPFSSSAQQIAMAPNTQECPYQDPDSVQISWTSPCEQGTWLLDTQTGCRMWDWHPDPNDRAVWSGSCPSGKKQGRGIVQWFEHGTRIDHFEGMYRDDRREGFGRYDWNDSDNYQGQYVNDVPQGFGTAHIAGETFAGEWTNGCFRKGGHVVAIGVPRTSCAGGQSASLERPQTAAF
jgi:hypothetical protein